MWPVQQGGGGVPALLPSSNWSSVHFSSTKAFHLNYCPLQFSFGPIGRAWARLRHHCEGEAAFCSNL